MNKKHLAITVAFAMASGNAYGAGHCAGPQDDLAMKTSSLQQALMVAALSCNDVALYNRFVLSHQVELQQADAALMAFFVRENAEGGQEDYHAFKTKAANVSSLESARNRSGYCANAERLFAAALDPASANLSWFVSTQWENTGEVIEATCTADASRMAAGPVGRMQTPVPASPIEPSVANGSPE